MNVRRFHFTFRFELPLVADGQMRSKSVGGEGEVDRQVLIAEDGFFLAEDGVCEVGSERGCCRPITAEEVDGEAFVAVARPFFHLRFDVRFELIGVHFHRRGVVVVGSGWCVARRRRNDANELLDQTIGSTRLGG